MRRRGDYFAVCSLGDAAAGNTAGAIGIFDLHTDELVSLLEIAKLLGTEVCSHRTLPCHEGAAVTLDVLPLKTGPCRQPLRTLLLGRGGIILTTPSSSRMVILRCARGGRSCPLHRGSAIGVVWQARGEQNVSVPDFRTLGI